MNERMKLLVCMIGLFLLVAGASASSTYLLVRHRADRQAISTPVPLPVPQDSQIVWSHQIESLLARREEVVRNLIIAPPGDDTFLFQAMALLSTPYAYAVPGRRVEELSLDETTSQMYVCPNEGLYGSPQILNKVVSPDKRSTIYVFEVSAPASEPHTGYFVAKNGHLTRTMALFAGCDMSYALLQDVRWIDNERIELTLDVMGEVSKETVIVEEYGCTAKDSLAERPSCFQAYGSAS